MFYRVEKTNTIRLTQTVKKGGCAAKVSAVELRKILQLVQFPPTHPELLIDSKTFDDAAIYKISPELALVQTLDFFTPIVDSPKRFGQIAAANALSDVYAMGGIPKTAMSILAYPLATMDSSVVVDVLQGASDKIRESGATLVGGHTIDDETLKFGLSVTGFVHPEKIWSNAGAQTGDILILTKPLGTGTITAALKRGETSEKSIRDCLDSMAMLNDVNHFISPDLQNEIHAATDITGFGLAGHALNLAKASQKSLAIDVSTLPKFENAMEYLTKGFLTKAHKTNREYVEGHTEFENIDQILQQLLFDPQTSGGLLLCVDEKSADKILLDLTKKFMFAQAIGRVEKNSSATLRFS